MAIIPGEFEKNILIDTPQQQKDRKLIAVFVGIVIIIIGVIYFGFFSGSGEVPAPIGGMPGQMNSVATGQIDQSSKLFESLSKVDLNNPIFKDKRFQSLISSDRLPVVIGEKGRENPFASF